MRDFQGQGQFKSKSELELALLQKKRSKCDCETILEPLSENKINVYEFFNGFVAFILATNRILLPKLSHYILPQ